MNNEWKLVPVTPTDEMIYAIATRAHCGDSGKDIWSEALAYAPVPPAGEGPNLNRTQEQWRLVDAKLCAKQNSEAANEFLIRDAQYDIAILGSYLTRLQAENAALQQRLTIADQQNDDLQSELAKARELNPVNWTDRQILDFLGVALRNVDLVGEVRLSEIRQGFQYMQERQSEPAAKDGE